jgi:hypothetical protein
MANNGKLEELRQAVLRNGRGREAEVAPDGQVVVNSDGGQNPEKSFTQETDRPKPSKLSHITWAA